MPGATPPTENANRFGTQSTGKKWWEVLLANRRRFAPAVLILGVLVVGLSLQRAMPKPTRFRFGLGPDHGRVTRAVVEYLHDGERVQTVDLRWPGGGPKSFDHEVDLAEGSYELRVTLTEERVERVVLRSFTAPAEGLVHIDLFDMALSGLAP